MRFSPFSSFSFILVPKVSAALWERLSRRDSVSVASHDDFKRHPHAHPPPTETEFRLTDPFPKRFANFGNESRTYGAAPPHLSRSSPLRSRIATPPPSRDHPPSTETELRPFPFAPNFQAVEHFAHMHGLTPFYFLHALGIRAGAFSWFLWWNPTAYPIG